MSLEKYLMKAAKGLGKAKGAAQWAGKEHPYATGAAAAAGVGAGAHHAMSDDDDGIEGHLHRAKQKLSGLLEEGDEGIHHLLKKIGLG